MKYVCVLSTNNFLDGILVLNENLKRVGSKYSLLCIINETIGKEEREILDYFQIEYKELPSIKYSKTEGIWKNTFDKINVFSLEEYDKIVYLDCDMLIRCNIDELFEKEPFTAANDVPFLEPLNSAIMVINPNNEDYENLKAKLKEAEKNDRHEIGDQQIICDYFTNAKLLDNSYNVMRAIGEETAKFKDERENEEIEKHYVKLSNKKCNEEKVIHYVYPIKPWMVNKPYNDNYYYEYKPMLDTVRINKMKYYLSKKKLLVIFYLSTIGKNEMETIKSLKDQTFPNLTFLFISNQLNELNKFIESIGLKNVTCLNKCDNLEEWYSNHDYITQIEPGLYLSKTCYEESIKQMILYDLDCVQFDCAYAYYEYYFKIYKGEEIEQDSYSISKDQYDKIYKKEFINKKDEIKTIGVLGNNFYYSLNKY